jgi:hypothetical protein
LQSFISVFQKPSWFVDHSACGVLIFASTAHDFFETAFGNLLSGSETVSTVITGFNTDIEYNGVVYHVQTEDKGLDTPLLLSLVYTKGEILAAKRTPYEDLIAAGFDEKVLAERLQKQHRLICAAIKQGRVEDLKKMSAAKEATTTVKPQEAVEQVEEFPDAPMPQILDLAALDLEPLMDMPLALAGVDNFNFDALPEPPIEVQQTVVVLPETVEPQVTDFAIVPDVPDVPFDAIKLNLLDETELRGGDSVTMRILVTRGFGINERGVAGAEVMLKVLGAAFRPVILNAQTGADGVAVIDLQLPHFKSGRAALLVKATYENFEAELRRIVMQS